RRWSARLWAWMIAVNRKVGAGSEIGTPVSLNYSPGFLKKGAVFVSTDGPQMRMLSTLPVSSKEPKPMWPAPNVLSSANIIGLVLSCKKILIVPVEGLVFAL